MQRDCVMAISRGGRYTLDNVVPACASCNTSKCNDEVTGWMRRKRLDERRFLTRYIEIRSALTRAAVDCERARTPVGERRVVEQTRPPAGEGREDSAG